MAIFVRMRRAVDRGFERLSARPLGIIVFGASVVMLVMLQNSQVGRFRVRALAEARVVEHPAVVQTVVERAHVRPGDLVEAGELMVELSPRFVDIELAEIDAKIEQVRREATLAAAELAIEEERWLNAPDRRRPSRPSLSHESNAFHAARFEFLKTRREALLSDRGELAVKSNLRGRVVATMPLGASVDVGTSVATVAPEYAEEIVAYVPPETNPVLVEIGMRARLLESQVAGCRTYGTVLRTGAGVVEAPRQLRGFLRLPMHGMPVYISVPEGCDLGVGQVLAVEFAMARSG
jgi:biotin carboxyl carrier protein